MLNYDEQADAVKDAIKAHQDKHGGEFGLRDFPGERFRISEDASFYTTGGNGLAPGVQIYTQRWCGPERGWLDFARAYPTELDFETRRLSG